MLLCAERSRYDQNDVPADMLSICESDSVMDSDALAWLAAVSMPSAAQIGTM